MNYYEYEKTAEYNRQNVQTAFEQMRLEKIARQANPCEPSRSRRILLSLANWMISAGRQLRKRHEAPTVNCGKAPTGSYAH